MSAVFIGKGPRNGALCEGEGKPPEKPVPRSCPTAICSRCKFETYVGMRGAKAGLILRHRKPPEAPKQ